MLEDASSGQTGLAVGATGNNLLAFQYLQAHISAAESPVTTNKSPALDPERDDA